MCAAYARGNFSWRGEVEVSLYAVHDVMDGRTTVAQEGRTDGPRWPWMGKTWSSVAWMTEVTSTRCVHWPGVRWLLLHRSSDMAS